MTDCRNCARDTELFLCGLCTTELADMLGELPWLCRQLEITVVRQDKLRTGAIGRSSDNPSPVNVGAMELARAVRGVLSTIVRDLCEHAGRPVPDVAVTAEMAGWLHGHVQSIACSESAGESFREIETARHDMLAAINRSSRMYCGPCTTVVSHDPAGRDIECGFDLYADRETLEDIHCPRCRRFVNPREQLLITVKRRDLLPEPKLLETLDTLGEKVSRVKLYGWIRDGRLRPRGYVHHGQIVTERIQRGDARLFSLSQARQLRWRDDQELSA